MKEHESPQLILIVPVQSLFGLFLHFSAELSLLVPILFLFCICLLCSCFISDFFRDKQGQSLFVPACPFLSPSVSFRPCLSLLSIIVPFCLCLSQQRNIRQESCLSSSWCFEHPGSYWLFLASLCLFHPQGIISFSSRVSSTGPGLFLVLLASMWVFYPP